MMITECEALKMTKSSINVVLLFSNTLGSEKKLNSISFTDNLHLSSQISLTFMYM